jgi:hypothetical protein
MEMSEKVKIKSFSSGIVWFGVPARHVSFKFMPGMVRQISKEIMDEAIYEGGVMKLFKEGFLKILNDVEFEKQLMIIDEDDPKSNRIVADLQDIEKKLKGSKLQLDKFLENASQSTLDETVNIARKQKMTGINIVNSLKKYCDVDILKAVALEESMEDPLSAQ